MLKINEFKPGVTGNIKLLVRSIEEKQAKNGAVYIAFTLTDGDQMIVANMWDKDKNTFTAVTGTVIEAHLQARNYNNACVYNLLGFTPTTDNPEDYVLQSPLPAEKMFSVIYSYAGNLGVYSKLTQKILEDNKEKLLIWTAAKKIHHSIRGGLLYHMYRMLKAASYLAGTYTVLDKNLLCAGTILHDIGKIQELQCDDIGATEYSVEGNLLGHLYLGAQMVGKYAEKIRFPEKETMLLQHMLVSHHGKAEYGAIRTPAIPEAAALFHIDTMDAEMYQYEDVRKGMEPNTTSDLIFGLGTRVYNP